MSAWLCDTGFKFVPPLLVNLPPSPPFHFSSSQWALSTCSWGGSGGRQIASCLSLTPVHIQNHHYSENPVLQKKSPITSKIYLLLKWGNAVVLPPLGFPEHPSSVLCQLSVPVCLTQTASQSPVRVTDSPGSGFSCVSLLAWSSGDSSKGSFHYFYSHGGPPLPRLSRSRVG